MKGLKLRFDRDSATILHDENVEGPSAQVQNICVNLATEAPAPIFEGRGTSLLKTFTSTGFVSHTFAQHQANFAAIDSLFFCKTFNTEGAAIADINLYAPVGNSDILTFSLEVMFRDDTTETTTVTA